MIIDTATPLKASAKAENMPAVLFRDIALAVPIPREVRPIAKPRAVISFTLIKSKTKVDSDAPIIPVAIVMIAVSEGKPLISSLIPIAIGAVTDLGNILRISYSSNPKLFAK